MYLAFEKNDVAGKSDYKRLVQHRFEVSAAPRRIRKVNQSIEEKIVKYGLINSAFANCERYISVVDN